jgi:hypothetical protein
MVRIVDGPNGPMIISDTSQDDPLSGRMAFPDHGYPPRPGEEGPARTPWARQSRGGALGRSEQFPYDADGQQGKVVTLINTTGNDFDAVQMILTIAPPQVIKRAFQPVLMRLGGGTSASEDNFNSLGDFPGTAAPVAWPPFEALVTWGVGGISSTAAVDFLNGLTVNLTASFIRVDVRIADVPDTGSPGTSAIYVLGAWIGPGFARPGTAQKTVQVGQIASLAEGDVFPIPRFAKSATVIGCDPGATPNVSVATLRLWQSADGVAGANNVGNFICTGNQPAPFDLPAGAAYASVINGMAVSSRFSIVYNLAI